MRTDRLVLRLAWTGALVLAATLPLPLTAQTEAVDQLALTTRIKELVAASGDTRFVAPLPGSRSAVVSVDTSKDLYFYLERGSLRGDSIDTFYAALDSGDTEAAYEAFLAHSIILLRATDYGWNGLGTPMQVGRGRDAREIPDVLFKDTGGTFVRTEQITAEDQEAYVGLLMVVVEILEGRS